MVELTLQEVPSQAVQVHGSTRDILVGRGKYLSTVLTVSLPLALNQLTKYLPGLVVNYAQLAGCQMTLRELINTPDVLIQFKLFFLLYFNHVQGQSRTDFHGHRTSLERREVGLCFVYYFKNNNNSNNMVNQDVHNSIMVSWI
jgi:hypothetical protein